MIQKIVGRTVLFETLKTAGKGCFSSSLVFSVDEREVCYVHITK
jgi:hypothetical protein